MGVTAAVVAGTTLLGGYLQGRAQQQQYEAQAAAEERNAAILDRNADQLQENAERNRQNDIINTENKRRALLQKQSSNVANLGASGIEASGSSLALLAESNQNINQEIGIDLYNGRQKADDLFQKSTDAVNARDVHKANASNYRKAGSRAVMNSMIMSGLSMASSVYGTKLGNELSKNVKVGTGTTKRIP